MASSLCFFCQPPRTPRDNCRPCASLSRAQAGGNSAVAMTRAARVKELAAKPVNHDLGQIRSDAINRRLPRHGPVRN